MPSVPRYDAPQVAERALPGTAQTSVASSAMFGAQGEALKQTGIGIQKAGGEAAEIIGKMQDRENADAVFRAETALKSDYLSYDADVKTNRQGTFAKDVTVDTEKWWQDATQKHGGNLQNDAQRHLFEKRTASLRASALDHVSNFEATQRERAHNDSWAANKVGTINIAVTNPTLENVASATAEIKRLNRYQAARIGATGEVVNALDLKDLTQLHSQVISNLATSNPAAATAYFAEHKGEMAGSSYDSVDKLLKTGNTRALSQTFADDVMARGMTEQDAVAAAREKLHGDDETHAVIEIKTRFAERSNARERTQRDAADAAYGIYAKTGRLSAIPANVMSQLDGRVLLALKKDAQHAAEGTAPKTDWEKYYALRRQALDDPAAFARRDLRQDFGYLGRGEREGLIDLQTKTSKPEELREVQTLDTQIGATIRPLGLKPAEAAMAENAIRAAIDVEQKSGNAKLKPADRQKVIDRMLIEGEVLSGSIWKNDPNKRMYEVTPAERARFKATIPKNYMPQIVEALRAKGRPITDDNIIDLYNQTKRRGAAE
jgi:hypothetical protein